MLDRCRNPNNPSYHNYGGRGVTVCSAWAKGFENFQKDMGQRPEGMTLDRINNKGNYTPSNCQWATIKEQCNNKRTNVYVVVEGRRFTLQTLAEHYGIDYRTINSRYRKQSLRGKDLIQPVPKPIAVRVKGKKYTLSELSKASGIALSTLKLRYRKGYRGSQMIVPTHQRVKT